MSPMISAAGNAIKRLLLLAWRLFGMYLFVALLAVAAAWYVFGFPSIRYKQATVPEGAQILPWAPYTPGMHNVPVKVQKLEREVEELKKKVNELQVCTGVLPSLPPTPTPAPAKTCQEPDLLTPEEKETCLIESITQEHQP